ncbi:MAG: hypothetical protein KDA24_05960 [Deltaproteobacteria bacterium]|nr:hypothetical protein [Deltaproteobacteria bacterium]
MSLLERLQDPAEDGPLAGLVALIVDDALSRPMADVVDLQRWPALTAEVLIAWAGSDAAEERLVRGVLDGVEYLEALDGVVEDRVPSAVLEGLRTLAARPYSPSRDLVLRLLDQPPVRTLLKEILVDAVVGFARKARSAGETSAVGGLASGLGRFAKRRAGTLGALAGDMVGAVGSEVEKQLERRAEEFTDGALTGVLGRIADQISDPARAAEQAALRTALLNGALRFTGPELARELRGADPRGLGRLARDSIAGWITGDGFEDQLRSWLTDLVTAEGTRTLGETLDELGLRDTLTLPAHELLLVQARHIVSTDAFTRWLSTLEQS